MTREIFGDQSKQIHFGNLVGDQGYAFMNCAGCAQPISGEYKVCRGVKLAQRLEVHQV